MRAHTRFLRLVTFSLALLATWPAVAQEFVDGLAQPVFADQPTIRHNVWIEIPDLDTDRDGINDRIRVQVHRPAATDSGVRLPVVMMASPYTGGFLPYHTYDITGPLYVPEEKSRRDRFNERLAEQLLPLWALLDGLGLPSAVDHLLNALFAHLGYGAEQDPFPFLSPFYEGPPVNPPYYGTEGPVPNIRTSNYQGYFLPRGFIFVYAQSLGTGMSTGCPTIGGLEENLAMKAIVDWFNGDGVAHDENNNPVSAYWTTGATTMIGTSYDGTLPIGAATLGVEGLKAIVPIAGVTSYYEHRRSNGGVSTIGDSDSLFVNVLSRRYPEVCHYLEPEIARGTDRLTGDYNAFWDERNMVKDADKIHAAVFFSHGLNDQNVKMKHPVPLWNRLNELGVPTKIWLNQGGHGDGANSGSRRQAWRDELNRFWSHFLFGIDNGAMDGPKAAVQRENGEWVDYATWPVPGSRDTLIRLRPSDGNGIGELRTKWVPFGGGHGSYEKIVDNSQVNAALLAAEPQSEHRLVYKTEALMEPVHISGTPSVSLRLAFSEPAAVVSALLVDYEADNSLRIVSRGWIDAQNRESISRTDPIKPGKKYRIDFDLMPHDYVFQAGSRIGLVLLSSDWEGNPPLIFTLRPPPGTEISVDTRHSTLTLPIVGGKDALVSAAVR